MRKFAIAALVVIVGGLTALYALTAPRRHSDFDTALRQTIDDVGTDVTATPQQQDLFDVHVEPRKLVS